MALYFLSYDLRKQRDYQKLYDELNSFKAVSVLESLWCFKRVNTSAKELSIYFRTFVDSDDGLIVTECTNWASFKANGTPNDLNIETL